MKRYAKLSTITLAGRSDGSEGGGRVDMERMVGNAQALLALDLFDIHVRIQSSQSSHVLKIDVFGGLHEFHI